MKSAVKKPAKKAPSKKYCSQEKCKAEASHHGFCRLHYLAHWKNRKSEAKVKAERRLNAYVDRLAKKYPDDFMERIKEGLESEEKFKKTVEELELDESDSTETEREYLEKFVRNIKGDE